MRALRHTLVLITALTFAGCADDGYDENRIVYDVSAESVQVSDVELAFESCSRPQQCDFLFQISNNSDRCVAFSEISLPGHEHVWLDTTFNALPRITGQPANRVRHTFVVLPPGANSRQGVDLRAITGLRDLSNSSITMTTSFFECARFTGSPGESFDLVSAPITFAVAQ